MAALRVGNFWTHGLGWEGVRRVFSCPHPRAKWSRNPASSLQPGPPGLQILSDAFDVAMTTGSRECLALVLALALVAGLAPLPAHASGTSFKNPIPLTSVKGCGNGAQDLPPQMQVRSPIGRPFLGRAGRVFGGLAAPASRCLTAHE